MALWIFLPRDDLTVAASRGKYDLSRQISPLEDFRFRISILTILELRFKKK